MQDGHHLADLLQYHRDYHDDYLAWVADAGYDPALALTNYRRALVAYYEAGLDPLDAPTGNPFDYLTALAGVYYGAELPGGYRLPQPVKLDAAGQQLLAALNAFGNDKELLLLADYHQLDRPALARAYDQSETEITNRLITCREHLGLSQPPSPRWASVVTLAGRQDLIATLSREEASYQTPSAPGLRQGPPPLATQPPVSSAAPPVRLSRRAPGFSLPTLSILVAGVLFGVLAWLAYDTFGEASPDRLVTDYFAPYPNVFDTAPPTTEAERDLQRILYDYDRKNYAAAYDELLPVADYYPAAPLYLGVCALALNDPQRARQWLARVKADSAYRDAADWYDALATLALGGDAGAKNALEKLANAAGHPYSDRARKLLSDL